MSWNCLATLPVVLVGICLSSLADGCIAAKILILPTPVNPSHTFTMRKIYDELVSRNHDVKARRSLVPAEIIISNVDSRTILCVT